MRRRSLVASFALLASCSGVPGLEDPRARASVWALVHQIDGDTSMQSDSGGTVVGNAPIELDDFGLDNEDTDVGFRLELGDGLSGVSVDYIQARNESNHTGTLTADWGNMMAGDTVDSHIVMSDVRLRWLLGQSLPLDDAGQWGAGLAAGPVLAHRRLRMTVDEVSGSRSQKLEAQDDGMIYVAARGRISWRELALTADYSVSDDWSFGGDFDGLQQDLEIGLSYTAPDGSIALFAAYQRSDFPASGREGSFDYDADFALDGYLFGLTIVF